MAYIWIALGSALGGMARLFASEWATLRLGGALPWGTILVNVTGSFLIGFFASFIGGEEGALGGSTARQFFMVGLCGGYTTFSSFSLETLKLSREGDYLKAGTNVLLSVLLCLIAVWLGRAAAMALEQGTGK